MNLYNSFHWERGYRNTKTIKRIKKYRRIKHQAWEEQSVQSAIKEKGVEKTNDFRTDLKASGNKSKPDIARAKSVHNAKKDKRGKQLRNWLRTEHKGDQWWNHPLLNPEHTQTSRTFASLISFAALITFAELLWISAERERTLRKVGLGVLTHLRVIPEGHLYRWSSTNKATAAK